MVIIFRQRFSLYLGFVILILEFRASIAEVKNNNCTELLNFTNNCTDVLDSIEETAKLETDLKKSICNIFEGLNDFFKKLIGSKAVFNSLNQSYLRNILSQLKSANGSSVLNISPTEFNNINGSLPEGLKEFSLANNTAMNNSSGLLKPTEIKKLSNKSEEFLNSHPDNLNLATTSSNKLVKTTPYLQEGSSTPLPQNTTGSILMISRTSPTEIISLISSKPVSVVKLSSKSELRTTPISNSVKIASSFPTATVTSILSESRSTYKALFTPTSTFRTSPVTFSARSTPLANTIPQTNTSLLGDSLLKVSTRPSVGSGPPGGSTLSPNSLPPGGTTSKVITSTFSSTIAPVNTLPPGSTTPEVGTSLPAGTIAFGTISQPDGTMPTAGLLQTTKTLPPSSTSLVTKSLLSTRISPQANVIATDSTPSLLFTTLSYAVTVSVTNTTDNLIPQTPLGNDSLLANEGSKKPKSGSVVFINQLLANASHAPIIGNKTIELRIAINSQISQRNKRKTENETTHYTSSTTQNMPNEELTTKQGYSSSHQKMMDETSSIKNVQDWNQSTKFSEEQTKQIEQSQSFRSYEPATDWKQSTYSYNMRDLIMKDVETSFTESTTKSPEKSMSLNSLPSQDINSVACQNSTILSRHSSEAVTSQKSWEISATDSAPPTGSEINEGTNQLYTGVGNISVSSGSSTTQNDLLPLASFDTKTAEIQSKSTVLELSETTPVQSFYISDENNSSKGNEISTTPKTMEETEFMSKSGNSNISKAIESATSSTNENEIIQNHSLPTNNNVVTAIPGSIASSDNMKCTQQDHTMILSTFDRSKLSSELDMKVNYRITRNVSDDQLDSTVSPSTGCSDQNITTLNTIPKIDENDHLNELITTKYIDKRYSENESRENINKTKNYETMIEQDQISLSGETVAGADNSVVSCDDKDYQYVVSIHHRTSKAYISTGVVITKSHVLTSASALYGTNGTPLISEDLIIRIRSSNSDSSNVGNEVHISAIFIPPRYEMKNNYTKDDLAVLLTADTIETNVIPLANEYEATLPRKCVVLGWGKTGYVDDALKKRNTLTESKVTLSSSEECKAIIPDFEETYSYCTVGKELITGPCNGDRGSPLICSNQLYGIVTMSGNCGLKNNPKVFTRISRYIDFIEDKVKSIPTSVKKSMSQILPIELHRSAGKILSRGVILNPNLYIIINAMITLLISNFYL